MDYLVCILGVGQTRGLRIGVADLTAADLKTRRPVWEALARILVDAMLDGPDRKRIAATLAASPYDVTDLEQIMLWEVYPACGALSGWAWGAARTVDPTVLEQRILRGPSPFMRVFTATVGRLLLAVSYGWREVKQHIQREAIGAVQQ
jgi:hypothetical protein